MAVYFCNECSKYVDDDYNPGVDIDGELVCEDCACEIEDAEEIPGFEGTREALKSLGT